MSYNILAIPPFDRQLKRLIKKFPSVKEDYKSFFEDLEKDPTMGTPLGNNCFKIRFKIESKGKGKSGGARVITNVMIDKETVYLLSIYDKSEQETMSSKAIDNLLKQIPDDF